MRTARIVAGAFAVLAACTPYFGSEGEDLPPRPTEEGGSDAPPVATVDAADASVDSAADVDGAPPDGPAPAKRVFVSSATYRGDFGGIEGADVQCTKLAVTAGLGGTWTAYLAALDGSDAASRVAKGPRVLVDGTQVFMNGPANETPPTPIAMNEKNELIPTADKFVWTGLTGVATSPAERTCGGWQDIAGTMFGGFGDAYSPISTWDRNSGTAKCDDQYRLYCFED